MNLRTRIVLARVPSASCRACSSFYTYRDLGDIYSAETQAYFGVLGARNLLDDIDHTLLGERRDLDALALSLAALADGGDTPHLRWHFSSEMKARMQGEGSHDALLLSSGSERRGAGQRRDSKAMPMMVSTAPPFLCAQILVPRSAAHQRREHPAGPERHLLPGAAGASVSAWSSHAR